MKRTIVVMALAAALALTGAPAQAQGGSAGAGCGMTVTGNSVETIVYDNDKSYCDVQALLKRRHPTTRTIIYYYSPWRLTRAWVGSTYGTAGPTGERNCGRFRQRDSNTGDTIYISSWSCK